MNSFDLYGRLRDRCLRYWRLHPDSSGSVAELWVRVDSPLSETSSKPLFADAVHLIDVQRRELEAARRVIGQLMPKLSVTAGITVDDVLEAEVRAASTTANQR